MIHFWLQKTLTVLFFEQVLRVRDHGKCWWSEVKWSRSVVSDSAVGKTKKYGLCLKTVSIYLPHLPPSNHKLDFYICDSIYVL